VHSKLLLSCRKKGGGPTGKDLRREFSWEFFGGEGGEGSPLGGKQKRGGKFYFVHTIWSLGREKNWRQQEKGLPPTGEEDTFLKEGKKRG